MNIKKGDTEDDLILDIIVLVGTVCTDDECANTLSSSGIIETLIEILNGNVIFYLFSKI